MRLRKGVAQDFLVQGRLRGVCFRHDAGPFILLLVFCYLANLFGLAMIIGAYFAGLMISDSMFTRNSLDEHGNTIHDLMAPIEGIFVPVFFVLMGIQVDVSLFADGQVLLTGLIYIQRELRS